MKGRWVLVFPAIATLACVNGEGPKDATATYFSTASAIDGDCPTDPALASRLWYGHEVVGDGDNPRMGPRVQFEGFGECALDGHSFHCEPRGALVDGLTLHETLAGDWQSGGAHVEATVDIVGTCGGGCGPVDANLQFERCHSAGTVTLDRKIDPIVKAPGRHPACEELVSEDAGDVVAAYVFNNTDANITLNRYDGAGAVAETVALQYGQGAILSARIGNVVELAWSTGCAYRFKVAEADQVEVFDGIPH